MNRGDGGRMGRRYTPMKRLPFVPHLSADEIRRRYLGSERAGERARWHALWLLADGWPARSPDQVAALVGRSPTFVRAALARWNAKSPDGLADGRRRNRRAPLLSDAQRGELRAGLGVRSAGRGAVVRAEGGGVRPRAVRRGRVAPGRLGLAAEARVLAEGAKAAAPQGGRRGRPAEVGSTADRAGRPAARGQPRQGGRGVGPGRGAAGAQAGHPPRVDAQG